MNSESAKLPRYIGSTPAVGDGNPASLESVSRIAHQNNVDFTPIVLSRVAPYAAQFHSIMSAFGTFSNNYTEHSEDIRNGWFAQRFAQLLFAEFSQGVSNKRGDNYNPIHWLAVQEHQLLGSNADQLLKLGIEQVTLHVPDVFPKASAETAVKLLIAAGVDVSVDVWNRAVYEELLGKNIPVQLSMPPLLDGFQPDLDTFDKNGVEIVIKSSGSGIPDNWRVALTKAVQKNPDNVAFHFKKRGESSAERVTAFFDHLGRKTRFLIGYPSELVQVVSSMRQRGVPLQFYALMPRGNHELLNLIEALKRGIVQGLIDFEDGTYKVYEGLESLPRVSIKDLQDIFSMQQSLPDIGNFLGTESMFRKRGEKN